MNAPTTQPRDDLASATAWLDALTEALRPVERGRAAEARAGFGRALAEQVGLSEGAVVAPLLEEGIFGHCLHRLRSSGDTGRDVLLAHWLADSPELTLADAWNGPGELNELIYHQLAISVVEHIVQQAGPEKLRRLAIASARQPPERAIEEALGTSVERLTGDWRSSMSFQPPAILGLGGVITRIIRYWRPQWKLGLVLLLALAVQQVFHTLFAFGLKAIIDSLESGSFASLGLIVGGLSAAFVAAAGATILGEYLTARIAINILNELRRRLFEHLLSLSTDFYQRSKSGDVISRFAGDLESLKKSITKRVVSSLMAIVGLLINVPVLFVLEWRLALVTLVALPIMILLVGRLAPRASEASYRLKKAEGAVIDAVQENVRAQAVIRGFSLRPQVTEHFEREIGTLAKVGVRADFLVALVGGISGLSVLFIQLAVVGIGAYMAYQGYLTAGALVAFVTLLAKVSKDAYDLAKKVLPELISAAGSLRRIEELACELPRITDRPETVAVPRLARSISFEDVSFTYNGQAVNLRDLDLEIPANQYSAFVGPSGSGKSTVLGLVTRFWDPTRGSVRFDGLDLRAASLASVHGQMGIVFQENFLFNTSIRENVRMGLPSADGEQVIAAARDAELHDLVQEMPDGYDTQVGEAGGRLSGGQRQRVAIARAMIRNPAILVLDEATSALDPGTEAAINATLYRLAKGRTVIAVTHRLAGITEVDRIFVMRDGRLAEAGSHVELLARKGLYAELWEKQTGFEVSADGRRASIDLERLRKLPLFNAVADDALLAELVDSFASEHFDAGATILYEGQRCDRFFVLVRGRVEVLRHSYSSGEQRLRFLDEGDYFGMLSLLYDEPMRTTVRALDPCLTITLGRSQFLSLVERSPEVAAEIDRMKKERYLEQLFGPRLRNARSDNGVTLSAAELLGLEP